ncbi:MAG: hypothetical protein U5K74_11390 [Gemmatimonadaceae bacterium]|nr:hypothetical protein [Gemmatimonadaceae bacterium]
MNQQAEVDMPVEHGILDLVERDEDRFEVGFEETQCEIRRW